MPNGVSAMNFTVDGMAPAATTVPPPWSQTTVKCWVLNGGAPCAARSPSFLLVLGEQDSERQEEHQKQEADNYRYSLCPFELKKHTFRSFLYPADCDDVFEVAMKQ